VGYGTENGRDYWKVRNSWGSRFGENGHARLIRDKNLCGLNQHASTVDVTVVNEVSSAPVDPSFEEWAIEYGFNSTDETMRENYETNLAEMKRLREEHPETEFAVNPYSGMSWEEFSLERTGRRFLEELNGVCTKGGVDPYPDTSDESKAVDWRTQGYVNPVKNQGSCGSCWAFSTVGALEGAHFKGTGQLLTFAEQVLVDCDKSVNSGCNGGMPGEAMQYVTKNGIALEADYPYTARGGSCHSFKRADAISSWRYIDSVRSGGEKKLLSAVQTEGPVSILVNANKAWHSYSGGILSGPAGSGINHAVLAVGYGQENGKKYWIIRNSWGTRWGESGYMRMAYGNGAFSVTACFAAVPFAKSAAVV